VVDFCNSLSSLLGTARPACLFSMGKSSRKKGRKTGKRAAPRATGSGPPDGATVYRGPLRVPRNGQQAVVRNLNLTAVVQASSGGVVSASFSTNPSSSPDWSALAALYTEFRILALKVTYLPLYNVAFAAVSNVNSGIPLAFCVSRNPSASPPATFAAAIQIQPYRWFTASRSMSFSTRAMGTNEMAWLTTAAPAAYAQIFLVGSGFTASQTQGTAISEFLVQFRNPA